MPSSEVFREEILLSPQEKAYFDGIKVCCKYQEYIKKISFMICSHYNHLKDTDQRGFNIDVCSCRQVLQAASIIKKINPLLKINKVEKTKFTVTW